MITSTSWKESQTLCWRCDNACGGGCSWSERFEPVPGWEAEYRAVAGEDSYIVYKCPEYVPETRIRYLDQQGADTLVENVLRLAADDFIKGCLEESAQDIQNFLRSKDAGIYGITDPETIIKALWKKRMEYKQKKKRKRWGECYE